jgi:nicotinate-nucleotide adenylyltransferase
MRRIGVMGGTFDPVHHGHLVAASEVLARHELDEVVFVPTGRPWQKAHRPVSDPEDRYVMTVLATAGHPRFRVSRVDIDRDGPTYSYDTLCDLQRLEPDAELLFITGADALAGLRSWHRADDLLDMARFIGVTRPGHDLAVPAGLPPDRVSVMAVPSLDLSSTECRRRVALGLPIWFMVPDPVVAYVTKRRLYQA